MKTDALLSKKTVLYFLFSVLTVWGIQAQTCQNIVGGSNFEALYESPDNFRGLDVTTQIGPSGNIMSTPFNLATSDANFGTQRVYGVVDNPQDVNASFPDIPESMILFSRPTAGDILFYYEVAGCMRPGTQYTVTVEGYYISAGCGAVNGDMNLQLMANPAKSEYITTTVNGGWTRTFQPPTTNRWSKFSYTTPVETLTAGSSGVNLRLATATPYNSCIVVGITKIEVKGCLNPKLKAPSGSDVCTGELARLSFDREYYADTYYWEKSPNGTSGWFQVGGNTSSIMEEIDATAWYKCTLTIDGKTAVSEVLKINAISCCPLSTDPPINSSRKIIYYDNFGTFSGPTSYTDAFGVSAGYDVREWQTHLSYPILPHTVYYNAWGTNPAPDGRYVVTVLKNDRLFRLNTGGIPGYVDGSGDPNGGVLFINLATNLSPLPYAIYTRKIENLCSNIKLDFEVKVANESKGSPPSVMVRLEKEDGTVLPGGQSATVSPGVLTGWHTVKISDVVTSETSVMLKVYTTINGSDAGGDLLLDDIIFRVCTPPVAEIFSHLPTLTKDAVVCERSTVTLATQVGTLLNSYYGGDPRFLFQASTNGTTWNNISGKLTTPSFPCPMSAYGAYNKVYFRVIAATDAGLDKFIPAMGGNPNAEENTNCKTVSISDPITITLYCACPTPPQITLTASKPITADKSIALCMDETITLSTIPTPSYQCEVLWFESNVRPGPTATPLHIGNTFNLTAASGGVKTYFVKVQSAEEPEIASCWRFDSLFVRVNPVTINDTLEICLDNPSAPTAADNICFRFQSKYADGTFTGSNQPSNFIPYSSLTGSDRIGSVTDTIKIAAGAIGWRELCYPGNLVDVKETPAKDIFYHVYLEDVTRVPTQGILLENAAIETAASTATNGNADNHDVRLRMLLDVTREIILESVNLTVRKTSAGTATFRVTPVLYAVGAGNAVGAVIATGWTAQDISYDNIKSEVSVNLNNYVLQPGSRYYLGFEFTTIPENLYCSSGGFPFADNLGGVALRGTEARRNTATTTRYLISNLKFLTPMVVNTCGRSKLTVKSDCPLCDLPDAQGGKRVEITTPPTGTKKDGAVVVLCSGENVVLTARQLQLNGTNANSQFDIVWYEGSKTSTPTLPKNAGTDTYTVNAWSLANSAVAETKKYYLKIQNHNEPTNESCWIWDSIEVKVNPIPTVTKPENQTKCNGIATNAVNFTGNMASGVTYNWTNTNTAIGLAASGTGDIASFTATNATAAPISGTITVTPTANSCLGTPESFIITVNPTPTVTQPTDQTKCNGTATDAVNFTGNIVSGVTYDWTNDNTAIGLAASGTGNIASFTATNSTNTPISGTIEVTPTINSCPGTPVSFVITVTPTPTVTKPANQTKCNGVATDAVSFTGNMASGVTYNWTNTNTAIGLAASGTGDITSFTATNTGNTAISGTIEVTPTANGCPGTPVFFTITVNPTPTVDKPTDQPVCNGAPTTAVNFTGNIAIGVTYDWTNTNTAIGLAASGTGNIASFTATNSTNTPISGTIEVTPTINGCSGTPVSFVITVTPTPTVTKPANQTKCNGVTTDAVSFTGNMASGVTYNWTNNNTAIGLAASGTGDIASFTATNTGNTAISGIIEVTPTANGCPGTPVSFTITVNPTPTVDKPTDQPVCNGAPTTAVNFTGNIASGVTYNWTNNNTAIGLAASGAGNIGSFTATNSTNAPISGTIEVIPTINGCSGAPKSFTITVNPAPMVDESADQTKCNGATTDAVNFTGNIASGVTYNWINTNAAIGLAASGTGDIASFTATNTGNTAITGTITVTPTSTGCPGVPSTFTITVNPTPTATKPTNQTKCNGAQTDAVSFAGNMASGVTYNWTNTNAAIGLAASGTGDIASFTATNTTDAAISGEIEVTPTANGCPGTPVSFTITVNSTPTVTKPDDQTKCNGAATDAVNFTSNIPSGVTYDWTNTNTTIGLAASGTGNIASFTATNSTDAAISGTIEVTPTANGCPGTPISFVITVTPTPTVTKPDDQTKCNGATTDAVNFTGNTASGVTYDWTNTNAAIGLAISGTGNITSFTATNTTDTPITGTIEVTPTANGCPGTPVSFVITVTPTPTITKPADQTKCNGTATDAVNFTGNIPSGVTYNWTNTNTAIGLAAASGTGDIASFTATNSTDAPITGTIEVTPTANGCPGAPVSFTITVDPTPTVTKPDDQTKCNGATTDAVNFTGNMPSGVTYDWTNTNTTIGLAASGTGDIASFTATNSTDAPISGTIEITPTANGCPGTPVSFTIMVDPTPIVTKPAEQTKCNGTATDAVNFTGNMPSGVTYDWTNTNTAIGLAVSGTGNISSFTATNSTDTPISGTIEVTPTANGCPGTPVSFVITVTPTPTATKPAEQTKCNGTQTDAVNFTGNIPSGVTYDWTNTNAAIGLAVSGTGDIASFTATNSTDAPISGTIEVTPTANGCQGAPVSFTITVDPTPTAGITKNPNETILTCTTEDITLTATGGVTFLWSTNATTESITVSTIGNYEVEIWDGNGCTAKANVDITEDKALPTASITNDTGTNQLTCTTQSISLTASGNGTYSWTNGSGTVLGTNATQTVAVPDTYTVTVTGSNGCKNTAIANITQSNDMPTPSITPSATVLTCTTPSIKLEASATGGDGNYTYSWGATDTTIITPGIYMVRVTDGNGCTGTANVEITENKTEPTLSITKNPNIDALTCTTPNITLTANTNAVSYLWVGGETANEKVASTPDLYEVTVTGENGCQKTESVTIDENKTLPTLSITKNPDVAVLTCAIPNITLTANTDAISFLWVGGETTNEKVASTPDLYEITVTGENGCTKTESVTINENKTLPTLSITKNPDVAVLTCSKPNITLTANTDAVSYLWVGGETTNEKVASTPDLYEVTVTGENGCTKTESVTINENKTLPTLSITKNPDIAVLTCAIPNITLTANTDAVSFLWVGGETTNEKVASTPDLYEVTVTGENGCTKTESVTIDENRILPTLSITKNPDVATLTCAIPNITLTANTDAVSFLWIGGETTNEKAASTPGAYEVTVTSVNGCTKTESVTIGENRILPTLNIAKNPDVAVLTCATPNITLTANTDAVSFLWVGGETTNEKVASTPDLYEVTVTGENGCTKTESVTIDENRILPTLSIAKNPDVAVLTCTTPNIMLTANTDAVSFLWVSGETTNEKVASTPDLYEVTVTGENGCTKTESVTIGENRALPTLSITKNPDVAVLTCAIPNITLTANTDAVSYLWVGGETTNEKVASTPDLYEVTVTGENGCTKTESVTIGENKTEPTLSITKNPDVAVLTCAIPNITLTANTNAASYLWVGGETTNEKVASTSGTYEVTVIGSNGCTKTESVTLTQSDEMPTVNITPSATVLTCTTPSITLTVTATGGDGNYTYSWITADTTVTTPGIYTVRVTDGNGCSTTASATITQDKTPPTAGITNNTGETQLTCLVTSISLTATGGVSYSWNNGLGTNKDVTVTAPNTYTVTVTGANGCTAQASETITQNITPPTANITNNTGETQLTCLVTGINLTATGGVSYSWDNDLGTNENVTVTTPGTYTVTVKSANSCTATKDITITQNITPPTADITNNTGETQLTCLVTGINLTATSGASYSWNNSLGTNENVTVTAPNTYTVTVTGANGCTATKNITITQNITQPGADIISDGLILTCLKPSITLTATGNGSYTWDNGWGNTATIEVTTAGTYTVTVKAPNGCTDKKSITIATDDSRPNIQIVSSTTTVLTCVEPNITLTASGGARYSWSNGSTNAGTTITSAGIHTVTVTSDNGCSADKSIEITSNQSLPIINVNDAEICLGGAATLTASGADNYTWMTGATGASITVSPTATTTYTVEGASTATGCKNTTTVTVYVEAPIELTLTAPVSIELGDELTITVTAERTDHGYFEWFLNNQPYQTVSEYNLTLRPDAGRQHFLVHTATEKLNCPSSSEIYVEVSESVPNAINPYDPNGRNCCFMRGYQVEIYNRYMQKVFEGNDGWDGNYRGALADPGTYFYRLFKKSGQVEKGMLEIVKF